MKISAERLRELLEYDAATGLFKWRVDIKRGTYKSAFCVRAGDLAGTLNSEGYVQITYQRRAYLAHRLAWLYVHGEWPKRVDHRDGDRHNNRLNNLRDVSPLTNSQNLKASHSDSRSRVLGASPTPAGRFRAKINIAGKNHHIGNYSTAEEAHAAYLEVKRRVHEGCTI